MESHISDRCSYYTGYIAFYGGSKLKAIRYSVNASLKLEILFLTELQIQIIVKLLNIFSGLMDLGSIPTCPPTSLDPPQECFKEEMRYNISSQWPAIFFRAFH